MSVGNVRTDRGRDRRTHPSKRGSYGQTPPFSSRFRAFLRVDSVERHVAVPPSSNVSNRVKRGVTEKQGGIDEIDVIATPCSTAHPDQIAKNVFKKIINVINNLIIQLKCFHWVKWQNRGSLRDRFLNFDATKIQEIFFGQVVSTQKQRNDMLL